MRRAKILRPLEQTSAHCGRAGAPFRRKETRRAGRTECVLPVIRRKPEGFPALELINEVQGDVLISLVRGGLDAVVHAQGEITLFKLQAGHTGPADGIRNGVADAVFGVNAGVGDSGLGLVSPTAGMMEASN